MDARTFLTDDDQKRLAEKIGAVERATGAEIVVAVATASGRYDRAESLVGLVTGALGLVVVDGVFAATTWAPAPLWAQAGAMGVGALGGIALSSAWTTLRRPFTSAREMEFEVERASQALYARRGIGETTHGAGILLYVSLHERRLQVLLDEGAAKVAGDDFAAKLSAAVVDALRQGKRASAIDALLDEAGAALAGKLPARDAAQGELADAIVVVHPF